MVPQPAQLAARPQKAAQSMSLSHNQFPNHFGGQDIQEMFEPTFVKLDKQVSYISSYMLAGRLIARCLTSHQLFISASVSYSVCSCLALHCDTTQMIWQLHTQLLDRC